MGDISSALGQNFTPDEHDQRDSFGIIPTGMYSVMVETAEMKNGTNEGATYLDCVLQIVDGDHNGRKLFHKITITNNSDKAVEIGHRELAQLGSACGVLSVSGSEQLVGIPVDARVVVKQPKPAEAEMGYGPRNEIQAFFTLGEGPAMQEPKAQTATRAQVAKPPTQERPKVAKPAAATVEAKPAAATVEAKPAAATVEAKPATSGAGRTKPVWQRD